MEITRALPDKANKPKRVLISKSPDIFASGGTTRLRTSPPSTDRAYADAPVGIFVGIYGISSPEEHRQLIDMDSVGGPALPPTSPSFTQNPPFSLVERASRPQRHKTLLSETGVTCLISSGHFNLGERPR